MGAEDAGTGRQRVSTVPALNPDLFFLIRLLVPLYFIATTAIGTRQVAELHLCG